MVNVKAHSSVRGVVEIKADREGPRVVISGGTHGDEISGVCAVEKLLFDYSTRARLLTCGTLTLVRANEEALLARQRYIRYNLNRLYKDTYSSDIDTHSYEYRRVQELKPFLESCDYFFDLHSAPIAQEPFLVCETEPLQFYSQLGIGKIITGWNTFSSGSVGGDGENYANRHGAKAATLEAGSHFDPESIDVAYTATLSLLSLLNMIDMPLKAVSTSTEIFDMYRVQTKDYEDFTYVSGVRNFLPIPPGGTFAHQNGQPLVVLEESYLLIPMKPEETKIGEEVCYLGRKLSA